jgi:hypothetical protein
MKKWTLAVMAVLSVMAGPVMAQAADARRATAEEMLNVMRYPEMMAKSFDTVKQMVPGYIKQRAGMAGQTNVPPDLSTQLRKVMDLMSEEFSWDKMKGDYITLYAETFTEQEMKDIIAFYRSPSGKSFVDKQPELSRRAMELSKMVMARAMPKIRALDEELKAKTAAAPAPVAAGK